MQHKFSSLSSRHCRQQFGFTLIELLAVIVIVAILFTYTTLAIRTDSPEESIRTEAQRLERLIQLALEESILRGEEYGMEIFIDGYRFLRLSDNQWQPVTGDKILRERELPNKIELEMQLEQTDIVIGLSSDPLDESVDLDANKEAETDTENNSIKPHIYLLSSGEVTPEFDIRFYILGVENSYIVKGQFDGTLSTKLSDL